MTLPELNYGVLRDQLDGFIRATGNRIEREWPRSLAQHEGSAGLVLGIYRLAENCFHTCRFVLADTPRNSARKTEFALATPPLARALLEWLVTTVYLFEDLPHRTVEFYKAGWREGVRETERLRRDRSHDPVWREIVKQRAEDLRGHYDRFEITATEAADVEKRIRPWPQVGAIVERMEGARGAFVAHLNDWYYRTLSSLAHPTWMGVSQARPLLLDSMSIEEREAHLQLARSKQVSVTLSLMLALATELDRELGFGDQARAQYSWTILKAWDPDVADLHGHLYPADRG